MDISNKALAMFLVVAVVVSLAGTFYSLRRLDSLSTTGFATSTGTAQVNITSLASLVFTVNSIDFGIGNVNTTGGGINNCTLYANKSGAAGFKSANCANFATTMPVPFIIENDGNLPLNVTLNASKNATEFIGGGSATHAYPQFQYLVDDNETGSCPAGLGPLGFTDVNKSGPGTLVCQNFDYQAANDTLVIGVRILIPDDAASGFKTATFTATGTNP
jgi:hypothetical protein